MSSAPYRPTEDVENWHFILKWNHLCFYSEDQAEVISKMSWKFLVEWWCTETRELQVLYSPLQNHPSDFCWRFLCGWKTWPCNFTEHLLCVGRACIFVYECSKSCQIARHLVTTKNFLDLPRLRGKQGLSYTCQT